MQTYRNSLTGSENHSLEPIVTFFLEVAQTRHIILQGSILSFLLLCYLSDFYDPFSITESAELGDHSVLKNLCNSLLQACFTPSDWVFPISPDLLPSLDPGDLVGLETRVAKRVQAWKLTRDPELMVLRTHLIFNMIPVIWRGLLDQRGSLIRIFAIADLMLFMG